MRTKDTPNKVTKFVVKFKIDGALSMPELLLKGHNRSHIEQLFEQLEKENYGAMQQGHRGRGGAAKFVPNESCPKEYNIVVDVKRKTKKLVMNEEVQEEIPLKKSSDSFYNTHVSVEVDKNSKYFELVNKSKNIVIDHNSNDVGYQCVLENNYLILHRLRGGGYKKIENAVKEIWENIQELIQFNHYREMKQVDIVVSALMGSGALALPCKL